MGKRLVYSARSDNSSSPLSIPELAAAGAFSAVPATLVAGPAERVKVLLQVRPVDEKEGRGKRIAVLMYRLGIRFSWECDLLGPNRCFTDIVR